MARRLDEAPRAGGLFYTDTGTAIDANGFPLEDAPARPENTKPEDQPFNRLLASTTIGPTGFSPGVSGGGLDVKQLGDAIGQALVAAAGRQSAGAEAEERSATGAQDITDGAKDSRVKEGATPLATGSATAEALARPAANAQRPPDDADSSGGGVSTNATVK
jgi:hypothetical protein